MYTVVSCFGQNALLHFEFRALHFKLKRKKNEARKIKRARQINNCNQKKSPDRIWSQNNIVTTKSTIIIENREKQVTKIQVQRVFLCWVCERIGNCVLKTKEKKFLFTEKSERKKKEEKKFFCQVFKRILNGGESNQHWNTLFKKKQSPTKRKNLPTTKTLGFWNINFRYVILLEPHKSNRSSFTQKKALKMAYFYLLRNTSRNWYERRPFAI